jgi:hypothetical protein
LLVKKRGVRNTRNLPPLTQEQILRWADRYFQRTGQWPKYTCGPIAEAPGETWAVVDNAQRKGKRGLPGGSSLAKLLAATGRKGSPGTGTTDAGSEGERG